MCIRAWLFYTALAGFCFPAISHALEPFHLVSPEGQFDVSFEAPPHEMYVDPDKERPTAGLKSIHYRVSFYKRGSHTPQALTDYYDIQAGTERPFPTPAAAVERDMIWSPQEDFVILPKENWPPEKKKTVRRKAVSLNTDFVWQTLDFSLEDSPLVWSDRFVVAGNFREECRMAVGEFDARTGKLSFLSEAALPAGALLVSSSDQSLLMKKVLGPCATAEEAKTFTPECSLLDLRFNRKRIVSCPS